MGITSTLARRGSGISRLCGRRWLSSSSSSKSVVSPWLMLQPDADNVYKFYNIEDMKVAWACHMKPGTKIVGSSHGWLIYFDRLSRSLSLSNPVAGDNLLLPSLATLPDSGGNWVYRVIISSSSPGIDDNCRALMIYGPHKRLAFCVPGRSAQWFPISNVRDKTAYDNFVYSNRHRTFFLIGSSRESVVQSLDLSKFEDSDSPKVINGDSGCHIISECVHNWPAPTFEQSTFKSEYCLKFKYLVTDEDTGNLYLVVRYVLPRVDREGSFHFSIFHSDNRGWDCSYAHKTIDFDVYKVDMKTKRMTYMDWGILDELALFVGLNDSYAMQPMCGSRLQSNSIYFTDLPEHISWYYSCHDNGVFHYETKSFSPCHTSYPIDPGSMKQRRRSVEEILSEQLPFWYIPTPNTMSD